MPPAAREACGDQGNGVSALPLRAVPPRLHRRYRHRGAPRAVNVSAFDFVRLDREVSDRWLNEPCPRKLMPSDEGDRLKLA